MRRKLISPPGITSDPDRDAGDWLSTSRAPLAKIAALRRRAPLAFPLGVGLLAASSGVAGQAGLIAARAASSPFLALYPAVIAAALAGGFRAGLTALILGGAGAEALAYALDSPFDGPALLVFVLCGLAVAFAAEALHSLFDELHAAKARLELQARISAHRRTRHRRNDRREWRDYLRQRKILRHFPIFAR